MDIKGFNGRYRVSNKGNVKSLGEISVHNIAKVKFIRKGKVLKQQPNNNGYLRD